METKDLNYPQAEAALCIFEWMMDQKSRYGDESEQSPNEVVRVLLDLWDGVGWAQMRDLVIRYASTVEGFYTQLCQELGEDAVQRTYMAYDWEFIPAVMNCTDWRFVGKYAYKGDPVIPFDDGFRQRFDEHHAIALRHGWIGDAKHWAKQLWAYPELVDEHEDSVDRAIKNGEQPEAFVRWFGEKYDLLPAYSFSP